MRDIIDALIDVGFGLIVIVAAVIVFTASIVWLLATWGVVFGALGGS